MDEEILREVKELLKVWGTSVTAETALRQDLGMDGDDAVEFMGNFAAKFDVEMSEFRFSDHFGSEGFNPFLTLWRLLTGRTSDDRIQITVRDLVKAVEQKKWCGVANTRKDRDD